MQRNRYDVAPLMLNDSKMTNNIPKLRLLYLRLDKVKITKGNPTIATNGLKYFILQWKYCMTEAYCWQE